MLAYPVTRGMDDKAEQGPIPYKLIKELKDEYVKYGPTSPYVLSLVDNISRCSLLPYDWSVLARPCFPGAEFLLWRADYDDKIHALLSTKDTKPEEFEDDFMRFL